MAAGKENNGSTFNEILAKRRPARNTGLVRLFWTDWIGAAIKGIRGVLLCNAVYWGSILAYCNMIPQHQSLEAPNITILASYIGAYLTRWVETMDTITWATRFRSYSKTLKALGFEQIQQSRTFPNNTSTPASRFSKYSTIPPAQQTNYSTPPPTKDGQTRHPSTSTTATAPS